MIKIIKNNFVILTTLFFILTSFGNSYSKNYAVLFSAGRVTLDNTMYHSEYWYDLFTTYKALYENGFSHNSIYVLYGDGTDFATSVSTFQVPGEWDINNITDYSNTTSNLQSVFSNLASTMTSNDNLYFWWMGHGSIDGSCPDVKFYIENRGVDVYDHQLAGYINQISNYHWRYISIMTCNSGGIIDDISNSVTIVNTAVACGYDAYSTTIEGHPHAPFSFYLASGLSWETPSGTSIDADSNNDGLVSEEESYNYMDVNNTIDVTVCSDPGNIDDNYYAFCAGAIVRNTSINDNFVFTGNVTVNSGITLSIASGKNIKFENSSSLVVNGTLNAVGSSGNNITFNFISPSANGIEFNSGSSGTLSYCTIQNAYCGVDCNQSLPTITNCTISNNNTGIELYNTGVQTNNIGNNTIEDNQYYGIYMAYSSPRNIYGNTIDDNGQAGIYCVSYSTPYIYNNTITNNGAAGITFAVFSLGHLGDYSGSGGYNLITGNYWGVGCGYESDAIIGTTSAAGYNSIHDNTSYEVLGEYDSHVMAENNWWNRTPPTYPNYYYSGDFITSDGGTVDYIPALTSSPLGGLKIAASSGSVESGIKLSKELGTDSFIDSELRDALNNLLEGKYEEANTKYVQRFKKETNESKKKYILRRIAECYNLSGKKGFGDFLNSEVRQGISKKDELYATTLALENMFLIGEQKYEQAVNNFEILKEDFSNNESIVKTSLYNLICLNYKQLNNADKVKQYYAELKENYPDDELTIQSMILMGEFNDNTPRVVADKKENTNTTDESIKYFLSDNYPNPFNPKTKISFSLSENDVVKLKIYDILGQEIAVLADKVYEAGIHEIEFDASNLPSGTYFYNLTSGKNSITKKMLLMK